MRIKFTSRGQSGRLRFKEGDEVEMSPREADQFLRTGLAVEVKEKKEVSKNG